MDKILRKLNYMFEIYSDDEIGTVLKKNTSLDISEVKELTKLKSIENWDDLKVKTLVSKAVGEKHNIIEKELKYSIFYGKEYLAELNWLVSLNPIFEVVIFYTKAAKEKLKFPIEDYSGISPLLEMKAPSKIRRQGITKEAFTKYFDKKFFPILDVDDFRSKILAAYDWAHNCHQHEDFVKIQQTKHNYYALES